jgi:hypothetical protein
VKAIDTRAFAFGQTMMDNSTELARIINDASTTATAIVNRTIKDLQDTTKSSVAQATMAVSQTLKDLQHNTVGAVEQSKQTAVATVSELMETHGMLRSDTTALFERLREANILLQEVLSGAHENMSSLERTMVTRVSEFVGAMNDLTLKSDTSANVVQQHVGSFNAITAKALQELGELASQFSTHGRSLAEAVELLEKSNRRTEESVSTKRQTIEALVSTLDTRTDDFAQRLVRFSGLLDESLDAATSRAREIASVIAETSNTSVQTIEQQYELVRATSEEERRRTSETLNTLYEEATGQAHTMLHQSAERFAEIMQGLKQMSTEMQQELETTRAELRRGIFELPQETAESAAQMRRVIVDQIEALAELNRIVARHGRTLDTTEPACAGPRHYGWTAASPRRHHRCTAPAGSTAAGPERPQWQRLAERSSDPRLARRQPSDRTAGRPRR